MSGTRRERVCRGRKHSKHRFCVYVHRNKKGQIVAVHNIGRSTRQDARIHAKRKLFLPRDRGRGHLGDF